MNLLLCQLNSNADIFFLKKVEHSRFLFQNQYNALMGVMVWLGCILYSSWYFGLTGTLSVVRLFVFFFSSRQGFSVVQPWLSWNLLCRPGWPRTQKSACLCLPCAGIKGMSHHARLGFAFFNWP